MEHLLYAPLLTILFGVLVAATAGLPSLNRRLTVTWLAWLLALAPLAALGLLLGAVAELDHGPALVWHVDWIPSLGLSLGLYFDHLSALFALLVTGIGTLVVVYAGYYFKSKERPWGEWHFLTYLLLFMTAMLGLVLAGEYLDAGLCGARLSAHLVAATGRGDQGQATGRSPAGPGAADRGRAAAGPVARAACPSSRGCSRLAGRSTGLYRGGAGRVDDGNLDDHWPVAGLFGPHVEPGTEQCGSGSAGRGRVDGAPAAPPGARLSSGGCR